MVSAALQLKSLPTPGLDSSPESENGSTLACGVDVIDEILATSDACNACSSQSPREEQNVVGVIKCFNNQVRLFKNFNIFKWWNKQAESDLKCITNVALVLFVLKPALKELFKFKVHFK